MSILVSGCSIPQLRNKEAELIEPEADIFDTLESSSCQYTDTALNCVKVVEVYDGDTIFIDIPEAPPPFGKRLGVRIAGVDAPELATKDACEKSKAQEARLFLETLINNAQRIDIINITKDKYFRIGGTVLIDGESASEKLLKEKLAHAYYGGKDDKPKIDWCNF